MPSPDALIENIALRLARAAPVPGVAVAACAPVPIELVHRKLSDLVERGALRTHVKDDVRYYAAPGDPASVVGCVACGGDPEPERPLCSGCRDAFTAGLRPQLRRRAWTHQVWLEHEVLFTLAASHGGSVVVSELASKTPATLAEMQPVLDALVARDMLALGDDLENPSVTTPTFVCSREYVRQVDTVLQHPAPGPFRGALAALGRHKVLTALVVVAAWVAAVGVAGLRLRTLRKETANAYWDLNFNADDISHLILDHLELVQPDPAARAQLNNELSSLKLLDVEDRVRSIVPLARRMERRSAAGTTLHDALARFLDKERALLRRYNDRVGAYRAARHGPFGGVASSLFYFRDTYDPMTLDDLFTATQPAP